MEKRARTAQWLCAAVCVVGGLLNLLLGIGLFTLISVLIMGACLLTIVFMNRNMKKTNQQSSAGPAYVAYAGWFLLLIKLFLSQIGH
jgi:drug/metabolite transporter superfamily protein YnfA